MHGIPCGKLLSLSSITALLVLLRYKSDGTAKLSPHCFLRASLYSSLNKNNKLNDKRRKPSSCTFVLF